MNNKYDDNYDYDKGFKIFIGVFVFTIAVCIISAIARYYKFNVLPILASIAFALIIAFIIIIYAYSIIETKRIDNLAKKEKIKEISDYYRDKLNNYSPGILMYCHMNKINFKDYLVATIINLEQKKIISINNGKINILTEETNNLSKDEKYIIECLKKGKFKETIEEKRNKKHIIYLIIEDITNKKIYIESKLYKTFTTIVAIAVLALFIIMMIIIISSKNFYIGMPLIFITLIIFILYGNFQYEFNSFISRKLYLRSKSGIDLCVKMQSLKNFLREFTDLGNKNIKEVNIWDEYIIYSIILNIKGNLNKEVDELYKQIINNN
ncbi:MAG: hypothetical protein VZS44_02035 [Bacilli bacterium]|nr:hypothetical protein [Bacilli bacterium]